MRSPTDKRDKSRFCNYHASIGHTTGECTSLKYFLEKLVKRDLLKKYMHPRERRAPQQPETNNRDLRPQHVVDMIIGEDRTTTEQRKVFHLEEPGSAFRFSKVTFFFSDDDYPKDSVTRSGPLTVQLDIVGQAVRKVLVDNESSVDIIFRHTLGRMILDGQEEVRNAKDIRGPLNDFGNHAVPIQGTIDLPTTFGTSPQEVTTLVKYYIIDITSSYNVIIGRPTLFYLGAIISMAHMKVKFPTNNGP